MLSKLVPKSISSLPVFDPKNSEKVDIKWSAKECGMNITISADQSSVFLKEEAYVFRTVVATQPFMQGKHYWEIHADSRTEN